MKDNWPEEFPEVTKNKKERSNNLPFVLTILFVGVLLGFCVAGGAAFYIFYGVETASSIVFLPPTPTLDAISGEIDRPTQIPYWTPEVPDGADQPRPTMTPFRPVGNDGTLFTVHLYPENFVGETAADEQVSFTATSDPTAQYEENGVIIQQAAGVDVLVEPISLDGLNFGLTSRGASRFDIDFVEPISAIGLHFQTSEFSQDTNGGCLNAPIRYDITFKSGDTEIATLSNHGADFFGAAASNRFDRVEIRRSDSRHDGCIGYLGPIFAK